MAGNELVAGIAGLAEGIGGYFSERHKLRLEKEQKKEREADKAAASAQQQQQNILAESRLKLEQQRLTDEAEWHKQTAANALKIAQIKADSSKAITGARTAEEAYKASATRATLLAEAGADYDQALYDGIRVWQQATGMPGMAPSGPAQTGNAPPGINMPPPQVPNQGAALQVGQGIAAGAAGQPVPAQPAGAAPQGQSVPGQPQAGLQPGQPPHAMVGPNTKLGSGIALNQANAQDARDRNAQIKAQTEHIEAETALENNNKRIRNLELPADLRLQQQKLVEGDDKHRLNKQQELLNSARYDDVVALGSLHTTQAMVAKHLEESNIEEKIKERDATIKGLDIDIKRIERDQKSGDLEFGKDAADKGQKEAEQAGQDLDKWSKDRVLTEGAAAYLGGLKAHNGVPIPNPGKDKAIYAMNNLINNPTDLDTNYKAALTRLSELNDRIYQARYHEAEGEYLKAMGTKHISDHGGPKDKETQAARENTKKRYEAAKKEYQDLEAKKEKARVSPVGVMNMPRPPGFTMEKRHFENGNTQHKTKKTAADPLGILQP